MSYPFVQATADYGRRKGPVKAFLVHMAEGGGTVGYLSNPSVPRGVSVHYVIESTGRIVQMLLESHASGSVNPRDIRTTDDPDGFYGVTAAKAVMGDWWKDPNSAVISVEIEGFAKSGPNAAQHGSLRALVKDVRSRYPSMGLLGHRDFADYKPCPGKLIHWDDLGGHGLPQEEDVRTFNVDPAAKAGRITIAGSGHYYLRLADGTKHGPIDPASPPWTNRPAYGPITLTPDIDGKSTTGVRAIAYLIGTEAAALLASDCTFTPDTGDCSDAVAAEHERTRSAAIAAVEAI